MIAAFNRCGRDVSYREGVDFTRFELVILASGFHGRSGLLRVYLHQEGDFDLAILATDFCSRSGLLRVCLHWMTVWAAGF